MQQNNPQPGTQRVKQDAPKREREREGRAHHQPYVLRTMCASAEFSGMLTQAVLCPSLPDKVSQSLLSTLAFSPSLPHLPLSHALSLSCALMLFLALWVSCSVPLCSLALLPLAIPHLLTHSLGSSSLEIRSNPKLRHGSKRARVVSSCQRPLGGRPRGHKKGPKFTFVLGTCRNICSIS
mgnify:CR=1 FL=1